MEDTDRLLSEKEIISKARERFGLGAIKIIELLHDCQTVNLGEDKTRGE